VTAAQSGTRQARMVPPTASPATPSRVTVIVPAHNEQATIEQTVRSCLRQTHPVEQVIVVADNCTDGTAALARRAGATVIEGRGGSKAAAQNLALPHVVGDLVLATDGDNTLGPAAVAHIVTTMRAGYAGTCAAVLPTNTATIYSQYRMLYHAIANGWTRRMHDALGRPLVLSGAGNCHRTDVLRELGGFPEDIITEDFNLTWALHRRGYPIAFTPKALIYTQEPTSLREMLGQMHRWTSGFAQSMVKHKAPLLDVPSFIVVVAPVADALMGGVATLTFVPFLLRHRFAGLWRWWGRLWVAISLVSIGVAIRQVGVATTLKCLPGWFVLQTVTGPVTTWWLIREWVLGRHLTSWTGRYGRGATITPMTPQRKVALFASVALTSWATVALRNRRDEQTRPAVTPAVADPPAVKPSPAPQAERPGFSGRRGEGHTFTSNHLQKLVNAKSRLGLLRTALQRLVTSGRRADHAVEVMGIRLPVWMYWEGPCPEWIRACHRSVSRHADDVRLLGPRDFDRIWDVDRDIDLSVLDVAHRADFIRAFLLARFGGVWIDSDCLVMKPLGPVLDLLSAYDFLGYFERRSGMPAPAFMGSRSGGRIALAHYSHVCGVLRSGQSRSWASLGALSLVDTLRQTETPWYRIAVDLIEPVCISDPQAFFAMDLPRGHERTFNSRSICYMLSNNAVRNYMSAHPEDDLLADGTFFRYLLDEKSGTLGKARRLNGIVGNLMC
jgi:biofilm PGA synthesis N-glycosyltransferase PgaC